MFDSCTKCGQPLENVLEDRNRRSTDFPQKEDALVLVLEDGYGMYSDNPPTAAILCGDCADTLIVQNPWLKNWIDLNAGNVTWHRG